MGEDAYIDAHIVVDPRITVSEGHCIGDAVRDELINRFDDVLDVLVHVDPEDDQGFDNFPRLSRIDVQNLLDFYLADVKSVIQDFRIHYLDGHIEVEVILPFALSESPEQFAKIKTQCQLLQADVEQVENVVVFYKT
jgi:uncharacterized protein (DUF433 family)